MTDMTVRSFAEKIQIPVDFLIQQFASIGLNKSEMDIVTVKEKETLFTYLNSKTCSVTLNKLTLQRKTRSTLNILGIGGKNKQVQVEVRKKRTYSTLDTQDHCKLVFNVNDLDKAIVKKNNEKQKFSNIDNFINDNNKKIHVESVEFVKCNKYSEQKQYCDDSVFSESKNIVYQKSIVEVCDQQIKNIKINIIEKDKDNNKIENSKSLLMNNISHSKSDFVNVTDSNHIVTSDVHLKNYQNNVFNTRKSWDKSNSDNKSVSHASDDKRYSKFRTRLRTRGLKYVRCKSRNYITYDLKNDHDELKSIYRSNNNINKNKRKFNSNSLIQVFNKPNAVINRDVVIGKTVSVSELANKMAIKGSQLIKTMMNLGIIATINQIIDQDTAQLIAEEMGHKVFLHRENALEELVLSDRDSQNLSSIIEVRAPVVTIMGHVDHGKTSLLDCIRSTKKVSTEIGGITQHMGAYHVKTNSGMITFLDTPGHKAFTAMRSRGARITDIVVLVVAADDGVMEQTIEAIQHAKAAQVPIIVAINKIDKIKIDFDRVKNELAQYGILSEEWGGDNQFVNISAKFGTGVGDLLDAILLQAEILELKVVINKMASGVVIESYLDKGRGPVASVLIREGTLKQGDIVLCGTEHGRVRYMRDEVGKHVTVVKPSVPVEIFGLSGFPNAGELITVVRDEKKAREVALYRQNKFREAKLYNQSQKNSNLKCMFSDIKDKKQDIYSVFNIVLKSDVHGSSEAIIDSLNKLSTDKVKVHIIYSSIGSITETDVSLAITSRAVLFGFNVRADFAARRIIDAEKVSVYYYSVIYDMINEVQRILKSLLLPSCKEIKVGLAEVRNVFRTLKYGTVIGCLVNEGIVKRHDKIRILRKDLIIYEGILESLRRFKDDVNEVKGGMECGMGIKSSIDVCCDDVIEVFSLKQ